MRSGGDPISLAGAILPVYEEVLRRLNAAGAEWTQMDEPCLVLDLPDPINSTLTEAYRRLSASAGSTKILVATYFESVDSRLTTALQLPVAGVHLDLIRGSSQLKPALAGAPSSLTLSLGVIDSRSIWKADLSKAIALMESNSTARKRPRSGRSPPVLCRICRSIGILKQA